MNSFAGKACIVVLGVLGLCRVAAAEQDVGKVVAVRGKATIERGSSKLDAKVKSGIQGSDTVKTAAESRAKLLFIDDSVLTLSDNSRLVVTEFIHSKGERGKSIFNLLDGKMRSVVGKTKFEVQTPTAVAAARGTVIYFDVGMINNVASTKIICLEGNVMIKSALPSVTGAITLTPGKMIVITADQTALSRPVTTPKAELEKARKATSGGASTNDKGKDDKGRDDKGKDDKSKGDNGEGDKSQADKGKGDRGADGKSGVAETKGGVNGTTTSQTSTTGGLMAEIPPGVTSGTLSPDSPDSTAGTPAQKVAADTSTTQTGSTIIASAAVPTASPVVMIAAVAPIPPLPPPPQIIIIPPVILPPPPQVILPPEITKPPPTRVNITIIIPSVPATVK